MTVAALFDKPLNTTTARIVVTLAVFVATAARYLVWGPLTEDWGQWLTFIGVMSGLDVAHFGWKRSTFKGDGPTTTEAEAVASARENAPPQAPQPAPATIPAPPVSSLTRDE